MNPFCESVYRLLNLDRSRYKFWKQHFIIRKKAYVRIRSKSGFTNEIKFSRRYRDNTYHIGPVWYNSYERTLIGEKMKLPWSLIKFKSSSS